MIGSVFSNLNRQMRLEEHLAKTPSGLIQRLLALTPGITVQLDRPLRSLVAYDGR